MKRTVNGKVGLKFIIHGYVANKDHISTSPIKNGMYAMILTKSPVWVLLGPKSQKMTHQYTQKRLASTSR